MCPHIGLFIKRAVIGAILMASILGCSDGASEFQIRFSDVHGLRKGDPVYFEESVIGKVEEVEYTDAGIFLVSVRIPSEFASAATDASKFYIDAAPQKNGQKAIRVVQLEKGGHPIENGSTVDGHTKYAVLYEQFAHQLGQNIAVLESGINAFLNELQGFPENEQIEEIERQLDEIIADLGNMGREMKYRLEHEILPLLREKIDELRRSLEQEGREEVLEPIDRKMDRIDKALKA